LKKEGRRKEEGRRKKRRRRRKGEKKREKKGRGVKMCKSEHQEFLTPSGTRADLVHRHVNIHDT